MLRSPRANVCPFGVGSTSPDRRWHQQHASSCLSASPLPRVHPRAALDVAAAAKSPRSFRLHVAAAKPRGSLKLLSGDRDSLKTGLDVWDGARLLTKHLLDDRGAEGLVGTTVVEVGAGTGFVGMSLAAIGAEVCLTDGSQEVLTLLEQNVDLNLPLFDTPPKVERLRWGHDGDLSKHADRQYDLVVASECVYGDSAGAACDDLVSTLVALCQPHAARVVMSYTLRPVRLSATSLNYLCPVSFREIPFFRKAAEHFDITELKPKDVTREELQGSSPTLIVMSLL